MQNKHLAFLIVGMYSNRENKFEGSGKELLNDPEVRRSFLGA